MLPVQSMRHLNIQSMRHLNIPVQLVPVPGDPDEPVRIGSEFWSMSSRELLAEDVQVSKKLHALTALGRAVDAMKRCVACVRAWRESRSMVPETQKGGLPAAPVR